MIVVDQFEWSEQVREIKNSGETGVGFLNFFETWIKHVEESLSLSSVEEPREAFFGYVLRKDFVRTEQELDTKIPLFYVGQMLVLLSSHWVYREELFEQLTPFEQKLLLETLEAKVSELQREAEQEELGGNSEVQSEVIPSTP